MLALSEMIVVIVLGEKIILGTRELVTAIFGPKGIPMA